LILNRQRSNSRIMKSTAILPQAPTYTQLLEECNEIIVETEFSSRWALIEGYHQLGERINKEKEITANPSRVTQLAKDLKKNPRLLQRCVQFYNKYPDLQLLPEAKNTSWHQICNKYLPETTDKPEEKLLECPMCHFKGGYPDFK
jgi:hypothetical protein